MIDAIRLATGFALLLYVAVSLWPFEWELPVRLQNHAELNGDRNAGMRFRAPGIAWTTEPPAWVETARKSGTFEVGLRVRSLRAHQARFARIVTLSRSAYASNFSVAQYDSDLVIWLRTSDSMSHHWDPVQWKPFARIEQVFGTQDWVNITIRVERELLTVSIDQEVVFLKPVPLDALTSWDPTFHLVFGNEMTYDRPWLGEIQRATVRVGSKSYDYVGGQAMEVPPDYLFIRNPPKLLPFRDIDIGDGLRNVVMYVPLGFLVCLCVRWSDASRSLLWPLVVVGIFSLSLEMLQLFISTRNPSVLDAIVNSAGGAIGIWIAKATKLSSISHPGSGS